jgi:hypothetical protein
LSSGCRPVERRRNMTYYADFAPFAIRDHNEVVLKDVRKLRLEKRLRENRRPRPSWRLARSFRRMLPLPR